MDLLHDTNLWLGISFAIFAFIVWKKGKGAFLNMLDSRIAGIRKEIEAAKTLRAEAEQLFKQYQRKHIDAVKEAEEIKANTQKHAAEIRRQAEAEMAAMLARREKQLQERLDRMKQKAMAEIQQYAADLAIAATAEIITSRLDEKAADKLISQSIDDVAKSFN